MQIQIHHRGAPHFSPCNAVENTRLHHCKAYFLTRIPPLFPVFAAPVQTILYWPRSALSCAQAVAHFSLDAAVHGRNPIPLAFFLGLASPRFASAMEAREFQIPKEPEFPPRTCTVLAVPLAFSDFTPRGIITSDTVGSCALCAGTGTMVIEWCVLFAGPAGWQQRLCAEACD